MRIYWTLFPPTFPRIIPHLRKSYECGFCWYSLKLPRLDSTDWCTGLPSQAMENATQSYAQAFSTIWAPRQMSLLCQTLCCHGYTATGSHQTKGKSRLGCLCEQGSCCQRQCPQAGNTAGMAELTWLCSGAERWTLVSHGNHWLNC